MVTESTFWKRERVLVTGGSGFLGSHLCDKLLELGAFVYNIDLSPTWKNPKVENYKIDISNYQSLEMVLMGLQPTVIFHLAAQPIVPVAKSFPIRTFETNIRGTYNLLFLSERFPMLSALVIASTDKVYGDSYLASEAQILSSKGVYETSKICVDYLAQCFRDEYKLPVVIARCCNIYGERDTHFSRIIPDTIRSAVLSESLSFRSNGQGIREYIYVKDVVDAYMKIARYKMDIGKDAKSVFNIASGEQYSTIEIVEKINHLIPQALPPVFSRHPTKEIEHQSLDPTRLLDLGWKPQHKMDDVLPRIIKWYQDYLQTRQN